MFKYFNFTIGKYIISGFITIPEGSNSKLQFIKCCTILKKECLDRIGVYQTEIDIERSSPNPNESKIKELNDRIYYIKKDIFDIKEKCEKGVGYPKK